MTIEVLGKSPSVAYTTICTNSNCRAILKFDHSEIGFNAVYSMGREVSRHEGILCPLCNQPLKKKDFTIFHLNHGAF